MSESDYMPVPMQKMTEWMENGCRLGWLIDPYAEHAFIYRQDGSVQTVSSFDEQLSGDPVLPGFRLELGRLR